MVKTAGSANRHLHHVCLCKGTNPGLNNVFHVHPNPGVAPGANASASNNEPAGLFDAVQMGGNGQRLFTRVAVSC